MKIHFFIINNSSSKRSSKGGVIVVPLVSRFLRRVTGTRPDAGSLVVRGPRAKKGNEDTVAICPICC